MVHFMWQDVSDEHVRILQNLCSLLAALVEKFPGVCEAHMAGCIEMDVSVRKARGDLHEEKRQQVRLWHARPFYKRELTQQPGKQNSICNEKRDGQSEVRLGFKNKG